MSKKINTVNIIGKVLGVLWLVDGLLQLQPKMFGMDFVNNVLVPNLSNQPAFLNLLISSGIHLFSTNTVVSNSIVATLQIVIGILLLCSIESKKFKFGLYLSIVWGLVVWIFGEGLGNLFTGSASLYTGAPGAALIYAIISVCLLVPKKINTQFFAKLGALILLLGAVLQLQPMFWSSMGAQMVFQMSASDAIHAINALPNFFSNSLATHAVGFNWFLIIVPLSLSIALWFKQKKVIAIIAIIFLLFVWWLGQDFGGLLTIWTGTATDFNSALLIALLILPIFIDSKSDARLLVDHG